jgi:RNA polymerase primary sigma factor
MRAFKITQSVTQRTTITDKYISEVAQYLVLTPAEEEALANNVKSGDPAAMEQLIKSNLRFVISIAKKYQNLGLGIDDLISEGNIGLIKAAHRYDSTRGFKFISFAVWWIRQSIIMSLADKRRIVRLPVNYNAGISKITQATAELEQVLERQPTLQELAVHTEMSEYKVLDFQMNMPMSLSLDRANDSDEGEGLTLLEVLQDTEIEAPDSSLVKFSLNQDVDRLIKKLPEREQEVLKLFYGLDGVYPITLEDIGLKLNLSKERVRQIMRRAIKELKERTKSQLMTSF